MPEFICDCHSRKYKTQKSLNAHVWHTKHPEKNREREQRLEVKIKKKENALKYYYTNREKALKNQTIWRKNNFNYNKNWYQENKEEISIKGKIHRSKPEVKERIKQRWKETHPRGVMNTEETRVFNLLEELLPKEYKYVGNWEVTFGTKNPDFININGQKKIIEYFGDYWHRGENPKNRINYFKQYEYDTLVIWGRESKRKIIRIP